MKFAWCVLGLLALAAPAAPRADNWPPDYPLPQDAMLVPTLAAVQDVREDILKIRVLVNIGAGEENPYWDMSHTQIEVFLDRLQTLPPRTLPEDDVWPQLKRKDPSYKGLVLLIETVDGKRFAPLRVFEGRIMALDPQYQGTVTQVIAPDYGRYMEYWLFGTARVKRDQLLGVHVMPVLTFEQCRLLGQRIVETVPRQCLLPDNNLLLESTQFPTMASARIETFDQCLKAGEALIYTFPRRCVATGGRVFTEPPQVAETPPIPTDAPLVGLGTDFSGTLGGLSTPAATAVSATAEPVVAPLLPVSRTTPVSASGVVPRVRVSATVAVPVVSATAKGR